MNSRAGAWECSVACWRRPEPRAPSKHPASCSPSPAVRVADRDGPYSVVVPSTDAGLFAIERAVWNATKNASPTTDSRATVSRDGACGDACVGGLKLNLNGSNWSQLMTAII